MTLASNVGHKVRCIVRCSPTPGCHFLGFDPRHRVSSAGFRLPGPVLVLTRGGAPPCPREPESAPLCARQGSCKEPCNAKFCSNFYRKQNHANNSPLPPLHFFSFQAGRGGGCKVSHWGDERKKKRKKRERNVKSKQKTNAAGIIPVVFFYRKM